MNLYLFFTVIKDKGKLQKSVLISISIYVISLFFSIITQTSSSTYIEGLGYKGYFESGNSLCTVLLLGLCIMFGDLNLKDWKKLILIILTGIYLSMLSGMRTGLFGFSLIIAVFILGKFFINIIRYIYNNIVNIVNEMPIKVAVELFILKTLRNENGQPFKSDKFYVKEFISYTDNKKLDFEIKATDSTFYAQFFKLLTNQEINENDLIFINNGFVAKYKEPIIGEVY